MNRLFSLSYRDVNETTSLLSKRYDQSFLSRGMNESVDRLSFFSANSDYSSGRNTPVARKSFHSHRRREGRNSQSSFAKPSSKQDGFMKGVTCPSCILC